MKTYLIAFDDTDNLETKGTGHVLADFLATLSSHETGYITRHQLFVDDRVPFTSHNSVMCATVMGYIELQELVASAACYLQKERAQGSDPGLCVADLHAVMGIEQLVDWGKSAKIEVLTKDDAYSLAQQCNVHLSEHGGDGQGVVGALAGVGLRLSGNDGRVRGKIAVDTGRMSVAELLGLTGFDRVCAYGRGELPGDCVVELDGEGVKAVYQNWMRTVLVTPVGDGTFRTLEKLHLKRY